jgi:heme/copper-type cytochrome/quinol oxidase subunit 3
VTSQPWTYDIRPDTGTTAVRLGMWLFLASETMFFASVFSGYVLLRSGSPAWPDASQLGGWTQPAILTGLLAASTLVLALSGNGRTLRTWPLVASAVLAAVFVALKGAEYLAKIEAGLTPAASLQLACWFTLTGVHAAHVGAGAIANVWIAARGAAPGPQAAERLWAVRAYWTFVDLVWIALLIGFYTR